MKTGEEAWQVLRGILRDEELLLAMRASRNPDCQWFIAWVDDVYYPWRARGTGSLWPPADHATRFFPLIEKAFAAARRDMGDTAAEFARLWPPAWPSDLPDEPMLPGDWPEQTRPRRRRRGRGVRHPRNQFRY